MIAIIITNNKPINVNRVDLKSSYATVHGDRC